MDTLKEFQKMMAEQTDLALATVGTDGIPNVRIVNYLLFGKLNAAVSIRLKRVFQST